MNNEMNINSNFNNAKVGQYKWSVIHGWMEIAFINIDYVIPYIKLKKQGVECECLFDGRILKSDLYPTFYDSPLSGFISEPKPCEFEKGDKVLVRSINGKGWQRRHFVRVENGMFHCYIDGKDEWSSEGLTNGWKYCKKWEE